MGIFKKRQLATQDNIDPDNETPGFFPQVRQESVNSVEGASILGKFTHSKTTVIGDSSDLGLTVRKDGAFVDKNGTVYEYSRATSRELENAGVKLKSPADALAEYTKDTLDLKPLTDAANYLIDNSEEAGLSETPSTGKNTLITLRGADGKPHKFYTDGETAKSAETTGITYDRVEALMQKINRY
jgi:hypothetical protein